MHIILVLSFLFCFYKQNKLQFITLKILSVFSVHGILQAITLEWVAIAFSRGFSLHMDWTLVSCIAGRDSLPFKPLEKPTLKILKFQNNLSMISLSSLSGLKLNNKLKSRKFEMHNLYPENKKNSKSVSPKLHLIIQMTIHKKMDK